MTDPIAIESPQAQINRARFAGKDFFTFVDDIVARIQVLFVTEFNDFVVSGTGMMLIDIVSWAAETLSFYIDRQATESYISTARTRKGVVRAARQLGYKVAGAVSASVDLRVLLGEIQAIDTPIAAGFQFLGPNGVVFESIEAVIFPAGEGPLSTPRTVAVRQGKTRVEVFTSNGAKNQVFRLSPGNGATVAAGSVLVRVDGVLWSESEIITFDQTNQYELGIGDDPPTLRFGNGVVGNVPILGAEIRVEHVATVGSAGLVQSGTITSPVAPLVVGAKVIPLIITNPLPSSGGSDQESLDRAKANAPKVFRAHAAAITRDDYESLATAYTDPLAGTVAVAQAFVARGADDDLQLQTLLNNIRGIAAGLSASVVSQTGGINSDALNLISARDDAESAATEATTQTATASTSTGNAITSAQLARNKANQVVVDGNDVKALVVSGKARVDDFGPGGTAVLTAPEADSIKDYFDRIDAEADNLVATGTGIGTDADTALTQLDAADQALDAADAQLTVVAASLTSQTPLLADIQSRVLVINGLMQTSFETAIETELDAIFDHVDAFLAADCQANLIQVPILTRDADGFLTAPPIALLRSLGDYLTGLKEVTQDPEVVSGAPFLVRAVIRAKIGILPGFIQATVLSNVRKAVDELLRVRAFGASLRTSDLDAVTSPNPRTGIGGVAGVKYSVFTIEGSLDPVDSVSVITDFLDADGNLIIDKRFVISKGTVVFTAEAAAA